MIMSLNAEKLMNMCNNPRKADEELEVSEPKLFVEDLKTS